MKYLLRSLLIIASLGSTFAAQAQNYKVLSTPVAEERVPGKVVVQQFLSFECVHCLRLEDTLEPWLKNKADDVQFERMPVVWRPEQAQQAAIYGLGKVMQYNNEITAEQLDNLNTGLFALHFVQQQPINLPNTYPFFNLAGIKTPEAFEQRLNSIPVAHQRVRSEQLTRRYKISGVPMFIVDGTYEVSYDTLQGENSAENLLKALDETIEHARKNP